MKKYIAILVAGIVLALGPLWGLLGTVLGMILAFGHLAESEPEVDVLANDIGIALYTTAAGIIACPIGVVLIVIAGIMIWKRDRQENTAEGVQQENGDTAV